MFSLSPNRSREGSAQINCVCVCVSVRHDLNTYISKINKDTTMPWTSKMLFYHYGVILFFPFIFSVNFQCSISRTLFGQHTSYFVLMLNINWECSCFKWNWSCLKVNVTMTLFYFFFIFFCYFSTIHISDVIWPTYFILSTNVQHY